MYHHPIKFVLKLSSIVRGIFTDTVDTYEQIARQNILLTVVKSNDVGVIVVTEVFEVDLKDVGVGAKDDVNIAEATHLTACDELEPAIVMRFAFEGKVYLFTEISYHIVNLKVIAKIINSHLTCKRVRVQRKINGLL